MSTPFDNVNIDDVTKSLGDAYTGAMRRAAMFYGGDHWQAGNGWTGPRPAAGDTDYSTVTTEIQRQFVHRNAVKETVDRHRNGVIGREPMWRVVPRRTLADGQGPTGGEQVVIDAATEMLKSWIDKRRGMRVFSDAVAQMVNVGRSPLRLFVPPAQRDDNGMLPVVAADEAIDYVYVMMPSAEQSMIYTDDDSQEEAGVYAYVKEHQRHAELCYLDGADTVLRSTGDGGGGDDEYRIDLNGRLTIHEIKRDAQTTDAVMSAQRLLNMAKSMMQRNVITGGFLERVLLNVQLPGEKKREADGSTVFHPEPHYIGAGTTNYLTGVTVTDRDGRTTVATPGIVYRDPVPVSTFKDTEQSAYESILGEVHQMHYAMAGDATASGTSRQTAMADYVVDLLATKEEVDRAWKWLLETVLQMAATFSGQPDLFGEVQVMAEAQIDPGPITSEMMRATNELVRDGLLSRATGQAWIGIGDSDEEAEKIANEQGTAAGGAIGEIETLLQARRNG